MAWLHGNFYRATPTSFDFFPRPITSVSLVSIDRCDRSKTCSAIAAINIWKHYRDDRRKISISAIECTPQYTVIGDYIPEDEALAQNFVRSKLVPPVRDISDPKSMSASFPFCPLPSPSYECKNEKITFEHQPCDVQSCHIWTWRQRSVLSHHWPFQWFSCTFRRDRGDHMETSQRSKSLRSRIYTFLSDRSDHMEPRRL